MTKYATVIMLISIFGVWSLFSDSDYKEEKKAEQPKHIETFQEYSDRIDRVKEYVLERQMSVMLSEEKIKTKD